MVLPGAVHFMFYSANPVLLYIILLHFARFYVSPVGDGFLAMSLHDRFSVDLGGILELSIVRIAAATRLFGGIFHRKTDPTNVEIKIGCLPIMMNASRTQPEQRKGEGADYSRSAAHY